MQLRLRVAAKAGDRRVFVERKQQFDDRVAGLQADGLDALIGDDLAIDFFEAQRLRVEAHASLRDP